MTMRKSEKIRKTTETKIRVSVDLDGSSPASIGTTIPFFDHMLTLMAKHGFLDLQIDASGDTDVDLHHTVEDTGIVFGEAMNEALGTRAGIRRYGEATVPMDEALATVNVDLCSRPYLVFNVSEGTGQSGDFDVNLAEQFFRAFVGAASMTLHVNLRYGSNGHHILEAVFKAFGRALASAIGVEPRLSGPLSTKGQL